MSLAKPLVGFDSLPGGFGIGRFSVPFLSATWPIHTAGRSPEMPADALFPSRWRREQVLSPAPRKPYVVSSPNSILVGMSGVASCSRPLHSP